MKKRFLSFLSLAIATAISASQVPERAENTPRDIVKNLWSIAARGELLNHDGWKRASGLFTKPVSYPGNDALLVFSDYYGVNNSAINGTSAVVDIEYADAGRIDSMLRYSPPAQSGAYKTSFRYRLVFVPRSLITYAGDGKTILKKIEIPEDKLWQIEGSPGVQDKPWTTVNGAIRYVLEMRNKTADPTIKKNADETITKLLNLH